MDAGKVDNISMLRERGAEGGRPLGIQLSQPSGTRQR